MVYHGLVCVFFCFSNHPRFVPSEDHFLLYVPLPFFPGHTSPFTADSAVGHTHPGLLLVVTTPGQRFSLRVQPVLNHNSWMEQISYNGSMDEMNDKSKG